MSTLVEALDRACPGCSSAETELRYIWMGDFVRHVAEARLAGREEEVRAVFAVIEQQLETDLPGHQLGDESNLAVAGFLEDLQNGNLHPDGSSPVAFRPYLGPRSLQHWEALNGFWGLVEHSTRRRPD